MQGGSQTSVGAVRTIDTGALRLHLQTAAWLPTTSEWTTRPAVAN